MEFRAVGNRCALDLSALKLPYSREELVQQLVIAGFRVLSVFPVKLVRSCVGRSVYRRGARIGEAPAVMDCSGMVKWAYGQCGLWLPRRPIQQHALGAEVPLYELRAGDAVFSVGRNPFFDLYPDHGVGHVGIATGEGTVVHAAGPDQGVIETSLAEFADPDQLRGARRYFRSAQDVLTIEVPSHRFVETSDDVRWIMLRRMPRVE